MSEDGEAISAAPDLHTLEAIAGDENSRFCSRGTSSGIGRWNMGLGSGAANDGSGVRGPGSRSEE